MCGLPQISVYLQALTTICPLAGACDEGPATGQCSSLVTLVNLARLGNPHVPRLYDLPRMRQVRGDKTQNVQPNATIPWRIGGAAREQPGYQVCCGVRRLPCTDGRPRWRQGGAAAGLLHPASAARKGAVVRRTNHLASLFACRWPSPPRAPPRARRRTPVRRCTAAVRWTCASTRGAWATTAPRWWHTFCGCPVRWGQVRHSRLLGSAHVPSALFVLKYSLIRYATFHTTRLEVLISSSACLCAYVS